MKPFTVVRPRSGEEAVRASVSQSDSMFIGGGTSLVDLMKENVLTPSQLIDINSLPYSKIEADGKTVRIGALVRNSDLAEHALIRERYPMLSEALLSGASQQLRNAATVGGNLLQRTRCYYFRDPASTCNKRTPGSGCAAIKGYNRIHAVLGCSDQCIATNPSDMCVALAALDAVIHIIGKNGERVVAFEDFYRVPGQTPEHETTLQPGELIVGVELPDLPFAAKSRYVKVRDRQSYEFALASAAAALDVKDGTIADARLALGGVATKPWRAREAEKALKGAKAETAAFERAADAELKSARASQFNGFKIELAKRTIVRALSEAGEDSMSQALVGQPIDRVDGRLKVRGKARYAAEFKRPNLAYAQVVSSSISKGKINEIDIAAAEKLPGVLAIVTHKNAPRLTTPKADKKGGAMPGDEFAPMQNAEIYFDGQPVALVVAETFEQAVRAAELVRVSYSEAVGEYDVEKAKGEPKLPGKFFDMPLQAKRGDAEKALKQAAVSIEETYVTPIQNHCAMEPSGTTAEWDGDKLTLYDSTQGVMGCAKIVAKVLGVAPENVRVICHFTGGGFGSKGFCWPHPVLAAVAARVVKRPVQLALKRQQNFTNIGHREKTVQRVALGADPQGKLQAIRHIVTSGTSRLTEFIPPCAVATQMLYACPNVEIAHPFHALDIGSPTPMRAPGECPGTFGIECAMDELAHKLGIDPLELRLINYAEKDPEKDLPWSGKELKRCYELAAEKFGWKSRKAPPRSMRDGTELMGWGMATATYPSHKSPASAKARMYPDGSVVIQSATQDIGTGTYTIMTQLAADALGIPVNHVRFELGETNFPQAPVSGGSQTAASVGPVVSQAATMLREKLMALAIAAPASPLHGKRAEELDYGDERIFVKGDATRGESYKDIVQRAGLQNIEVEAPDKKTEKDKEEEKKYSFHTFGAHFVEVKVDPELGRVHVTRVVSAFDIGRVLNQKTARSQAIGGIVFGIGMALMEGTARDPVTGRVVTKNLADYLLPVNADVPEIEVLFTDVPDFNFNSIGVRAGLGEIGITGISAAIANAVFHATGKRVRRLPITVDQLQA